MPRADHMIYLLAAGDPGAVAWIQAAAKAVVCCRGDLSLERMASLTPTVQGRRRGLRDAYLRKAAQILGEAGRSGPKFLHEAVEQFRSGRWAQWRDLPFAPDYACDLERALFDALKCGAVPGTPQGLGRIIVRN